MSGVVFEQILNVKVRGGGVIENAAREIGRSLIFTVVNESKLIQQPGNSIKITLTDTTDPFFLLILELTEEDYKRLRSSQSLLVDFGAFSKMLSRLIEECHSNHISAELVSSSNNSYCLEFVEYTAYRKTTHLSLEFRQGTDDAVKKYLAGKWNEERNIRKESEVSRDKEKQRAEIAERRLESCESERKREMEEVVMKNKEIQRVKDEEIQSLKRKNEELTVNCRELSETKNKLMEENRRLNEQLTNTKAELSQVRIEANTNMSLCKEKERNLEMLKEQLRSSESRAAGNEKDAKETASLRSALSMNEEKVLALKREIHKGNEVISKMQSKMTTLIAQVKQQTEIMDTEKRELEEFKRRSSVAETEVVSLRQENESLKVKNENQKVELERASTRIDFLSRQLAGGIHATSKTQERV